MKPIHALAIAAAFSAAAVVGLSAVTKTATLGASAKRASAAAIATRAKRLDAFEAALRKALQKKPPALPSVPAVSAVTPAGATPAVTSLVTASTPRIIYRRPAPIIIHKHRASYDDLESESGARASGGGITDD
jgi:hypothetical protein